MKSNYKKNSVYFLILIIASLVTSSCIKLWLGSPELGSKSYPIELYLENKNVSKDENIVAQFCNCVEVNTGYHLKFTYVPDEKAVLGALAKGNAHFGLASALGFIGTAAKSSVKSILLLTTQGSATNRSVVIGKTAYWKNQYKKLGHIVDQSALNHENILSLYDKSIVAYSEPESIIGFLVPRMYFLQKGIFPKAAIFVGSYTAVIDALHEDFATIGVVSESYIDAKYSHFSPFQIGSEFNEFIVLGISPSLPSQTIIEGQNIPFLAKQAIIAGFETCAQKNLTEFKKIFEADGIVKSNDKFFIFTKELYQFQQENIRVLTQRTN